jgi:hypothetical protein
MIDLAWCEMHEYPWPACCIRSCEPGARIVLYSPDSEMTWISIENRELESIVSTTLCAHGSAHDIGFVCDKLDFIRLSGRY